MVAVVSFIDSPFCTKAAYSEWLALPAAQQQAALQKQMASAISNASPLPDQLQTADGKLVGTPQALAGKMVVLFFSAEWCPACKVFLPKLKILYEEARENDLPLEIVYVSSDRDSAQKDRYMSTHGPWLSIPYSNVDARSQLKTKYGCFAGAEAKSFPGTKRRAGIPSIVLMGPAGEEHVHMDCDPPVEIDRKGAAILDDWLAYKWAA